MTLKQFCVNNKYHAAFVDGWLKVRVALDPLQYAPLTKLPAPAAIL